MVEVVMECVYFVSRVPKNDKIGLIKIGRTVDLEKRVATFRTSMPDVWVIAVIRGAGKEKEQELHHRFAAHREAGEWFRPHPELLDFVHQCVRDEHADTRKLFEIEERFHGDGVTVDDIRWLLDIACELMLQTRRRV
jgi:hypothetical protein